jgi:hypothetical protein
MRLTERWTGHSLRVHSVQEDTVNGVFMNLFYFQHSVNFWLNYGTGCVHYTTHSHYR